MGNGNVHRIKVLLASLVAVIAAMADIYIIVNAPHNYVLLGVISLILLIAVYLVISGKMQLRDWNNMKREEQYNNLMTSQKACYLQVRRSFRETGGKINELDKKIAPLATAGEVNHQKISGLLDALMQDQKKVAKLTVSRSKENANAIMNSNDKVIEEMLKMQEAMNGIVEQVGDKKEDNQSEEFAKVEERQQELLAKMQQLEDSLKGQIETITDKIQVMPKIEKEPVSELEAEIQELEPEIQKLEPEIQELEPKIQEPEPEMEDIAALLSGVGSEEEVQAEEAVTEAVEEEPEIEVSAIEEPEIEVSEIEVSAVEEATPVADSNKMMTPEDIAALIAGVGGEEEVLPETMEEPEIEVSEEDSVMPDLTDPNRKMSPEDIAALIANM